MIAALLLAMLLPLLLAAAFLLGRHWQRRQQPAELLSPVSRQHIEIFQGQQLNEAVVEAAKKRFRALLERGEVATVEASLRPGMNYVFQVRALAEIGTDEAGRILERQLQRRLSDDQMEQSWYWIDLAHGLRSLNREESLPHLLRCAEQASEVPLGHFFAAETVCFLGFAGHLRQPEQPLGRAALRLLARAVEGLRYGVQPIVVADARLGELVETMWDNRPERADPLVTRVAAEVVRWNRRADDAKAVLADDRADYEAYDWQMARLHSLEPIFADYIDEASRVLVQRLSGADDPELADLLQTLSDIRAEAGEQVLKLLTRPSFPHGESAVEVLLWSRNPRVGPWLCDWAGRHVSPVRRAQRRRRALSPRQTSVPDTFPYRALLRVLRHHPSAQVEAFLVLAGRDWDPAYRAAAYSSLGWWEPVHGREVNACLGQGRRDANPDVRHAARTALARLGECQALQWFRQALTSENSGAVHEGIQVVAAEGLTLLWPDLDRLADAEDPDIAIHAREALERLSEEMDWHRGHPPQ